MSQKVQAINEIWSVNRYNVKSTFLQKSCTNATGGLIPDLFLFFKKAKANCITFRTVVPEICSFFIFYMRVWD